MQLLRARLESAGESARLVRRPGEARDPRLRLLVLERDEPVLRAAAGAPHDDSTGDRLQGGRWSPVVRAPRDLDRATGRAR